MAQRTWVSQSRSFQQDIVKSSFLQHKLFDRSHASVLNTAAKAAIRQLQELFGLFCGWIIG